MEAIKGKIAQIKDAYSIVINKGRVDGVEDGMRFIIYEEGDPITDPDTGEELGNFQYVKAKVKTTYVSDKYSIAETYEETVAGFVPMSSFRVQKELPLDEPLRSMLPKRYTIKIGDLVRQYLG